MAQAREDLLQARRNGEVLQLAAAGEWIAVNALELEPLVERAGRDGGPVKLVRIDAADIVRFDTYGAWLLERLVRGWRSAGCQTRLEHLSEDFQPLMGQIGRTNLVDPAAARRDNVVAAGLETVGRVMAGLCGDFVRVVQMLGAVTAVAVRLAARPGRFRPASLVHQLDRVGFGAVPIILLIMFLVGCIVSQQGIFNFRRFGAQEYVVDLIGFLVLRELGVLIVSIMVAGRSGSSYTAELGSMKMREEIDALRTMGLDPTEILVLPRILALVVAVPMLTFLGSIAALYGGALVAWVYGGIDPDIFLARLKQAVDVNTFEVGMIKAPFMGLMIGIIACVEGFAVQGSAESLGLRTTSSVVKAIFLIIVIDGLFSLFFAAIRM
jgi:phospholipid/cholesterol/gamma-HCH transport system permease protein